MDEKFVSPERREKNLMLTVAKLIEQLQALPQDLPVLLNDDRLDGNGVLTIRAVVEGVGTSYDTSAQQFNYTTRCALVVLEQKGAR